MTARTYRGSVPAPPKDLQAAMGEAGRTGNHTRLGQLHAQYVTWLSEQGYPQHPQGRPARADEVQR